MNILVTGVNGQLGNHIRLLGDRSSHHYFYTDVDELDVASREAVIDFIMSHHIDTIFNCAAYTNVDKAEDEEPLADRINHVAVGYLAESMKSVGGLLVHVSTDYVFGGNQCNIPCQEDSKPNPTGAYGRTKLEGERAIISSGCRYVVFRTAWLYSEYGKNFCKTMLSLTSTKQQLKVVFDQAGTPTYAGDLAKAMVSIVERGVNPSQEGVYHFSNEGVCSWYDFAKEIARQSGHLTCDIQPCHSNEFPSKVVRPSYSVLDKTKFKQTFGMDVPYWTDSLAICLDHLLHK